MPVLTSHAGNVSLSYAEGEEEEEEKKEVEEEGPRPLSTRREGGGEGREEDVEGLSTEMVWTKRLRARLAAVPLSSSLLPYLPHLRRPGDRIHGNKIKQLEPRRLRAPYPL